MNFALNLIAKVSIILMCAALLSMLLRRASASTRHAMWVLAMVSALLVPVAESLVPQLEWPALPEATTHVTFLPAGNQVGAIGERGLKPATYLGTHVVAGFTPAFVWVIGFTLLIVRLIFGSLAVHRLWKSAILENEGAWLDLIKDLSNALLIKRPGRLLFSDAPISPMTWGLFRHMSSSRFRPFTRTRRSPPASKEP